MSVRFIFLLIFLLYAGLLGSLVYVSYLSAQNQNKLAASEIRRFESYKLADQLRQSSDDLTRFSRTYVVTGDPVYEQYFQDVLAIRDGEKPRPENYERIYWDFVVAGRNTPTPVGESVSLHNLMRKMNFTAEEFAKLDESKARSDALVRLEEKAMNAAKGKFDDGSGNFTIVREPDLEMAQQIMHGEDYHTAKSAIMEPISDFLALLDARTAREVQDLLQKGRIYAGLMLSLAGVGLAFTLGASLGLHRRVIIPVRKLVAAAQQVGAGEYGKRVEHTSSDEFGELASSFNHMTGAIQQDFSEREKNEKALAQAEDRVIKLLDTAPVGLLLVNHDGVIRSANEEVERMFGYERGELSGDSVDRLVPTAARAQHADLRRSFTAAPDRRIMARGRELKGLRKDGSEIFVEVGLAPLDLPDGPMVAAAVHDISDRMKAESELIRLSRAVEYSPVAVVITSAAAVIEYVNPQFAEMTGYMAEEAVGRNPRILNSGVQPAKFYDNLWSTISAGKDWRGEFCNKKKSGELFWVSASISSIRNASGTITHYVAVEEDITERKRMEEELRWANFHSDIALELTNCAYWHIDYSDPDYYYQSERSARMLGEPMKADGRYHLQDEWFARLLEANPETAERTAERYQGAIDGRYEHYESTYAYKRPNDGEIIWLHALGRVARNEQGEILHMYGAYQDITDRKHSEVALQEARRGAEDAKMAAESANRAKSDFLSHMSHELRTPLNGILGYAQILQRDQGLTDRQRRNLESIVNCGDHLLALINDVLDLSKIEAGRLEVDAAPTDLHALIKGVADIVSERAKRKDIEFVLDVADEVPQGIIADAAKLRQILVNFLGNAVKFTKQGQVRLSVSEHPRGSLRFQVVDTGVGMTAEEMNHIFDPFKQVEAGKAAGGTGLGLAISKRLADALGATIDVSSVKGKGSTFTVVTPLLESEPEAWPETHHPRSVDAAHFSLAEGQQWTILIADDRDTNRAVLQGMLEPAGFGTRLATDGDEALEVLRADEVVDLVLMDIRMPRVSGIEALKMIREDAQLSHIKVIAVTASVFPEFRQKAIDAGFDDFLAKPFRVEELMSKLEKHLGLEFDAGAAERATEGPEPEPESDEWEVVPEKLRQRLREALRFKNLTALSKLAAQLSAKAETSKTGGKLTRLIDAFDFDGIGQLAKDLENRDG